MTNILIVDDIRENLYLLELLLKENGYITVSAKNGAEALGLARKDIPDLIITDILMPVMDGFTLCREFKKDEKLCNVPFIFYTATYTDPKDEEFALSLGADRFIVKPHDLGEFIVIVKALLKEAKGKNIQTTETPSTPETVILKEYNEALVRKLEDKMLQVGQSEKDIRKYNILLLKEIEEHKRAEEALLESEERYRKLVNLSPDAIVVHSGGRFIFVNPAAVKLFGGKNPQDILGKPIIEFVHPDFRNIVQNRVQQISKGQTVHLIEEKFIQLDGTVIDVEVAAMPFSYESKPSVQVVVRDITERKRAEEEIIMLAHSLRSINECVSITDMEDKIIFVNESFLKTYGYDENELVGKHMSIVRSPNNPPELVKEILPATIRGGWQGELWNKRKDGSEFPIYLSTTIINDKESKPLGLIGVATDITGRRRAEKELIEAKERAEESDKLKSEFLNQMSHEIRTPINAIVGNVDYLNDSVGKEMNSDARDCFDGIGLASKRIIRTVDLILNAAELQTSGYNPYKVKVDLNSEILNKLYKEHQLSAKQKGLELIYTSESKDSQVLADVYSITQIFANLIDNAIKYTKKGKVEILLLKNKTGNIMVEIKDTGIGMSKDFLSRMFDPFVQEEQGYTRSYDGSGLGLTLVKNYCDINNAVLEVESEKNVGSTFRVIFKS
ncbi:MAG: PAS domain S-box protein [Ignavibacteriales bacterium]|nr:PAS domain S-box protein [Ignavibacteriales bacterium]